MSCPIADPVQRVSGKFLAVCDEIYDADDATALIGPAQWRRITRPLALAALPRPRFGRIAALTSLRETMPWFSHAIDAVEDRLLLLSFGGAAGARIPPIVLVGPPGCGKTYFAHALGDALELRHAALNLGGASDNRLLEGTARGYIQGQPSWPVCMMDDLGTANPLLIVEEVDKAGGSDRNGRPLDTLLAMLEPISARRYRDPYLMAPVDLSRISWILTANTIDGLPAPLLSRLLIISVEGPHVSDFSVVWNAAHASLLSEYGLASDRLPELGVLVRRRLEASFARHRSIRQLRTDLAGAYARAVRLITVAGGKR